MADESEAKPDKKTQKKKLAWKSLPDAWALLKPRTGILVLGFLLIMINRVVGFALPAASKFVFDNVIAKHQVQFLIPIVLCVITATLIQGITSFTLTQLFSKSAQRMITELRKQVQAHIGRLPISFYDSHKTGALVSRIMSDVEGVRNLVGTGLVELAGGLLTAVIALVVMLRISPVMTLVAFGVLLVFGFGINKAFATIRPIFRARPKITAEVTGRLTESLGGVRVVKGYHAEELSAVIMYFGARQILGGTMTPGVLIAYSALLAMLVAPIFQIVAIGTQLTEALTGLERTKEILSEKVEDETPGRVADMHRVDGTVEFEHVDFAYDSNKPVLFDISFTAKPDTVTALVGPSGAGKSTIIGLIAAFYTPTQGRVIVDGSDLATVRLRTYRTQLGVVLQDTFLFDGTIRENVAFARPEASEEEILEACRIARVDEFAEGFEKKYDTVVGERGVKLSGGQKQRVSIARAILADPRILILDEATSSLDSESEALIQEGLRYLMRARTTFVIAHRLSTIRRADQILVVEAGRIIERGTHESLYELAGRYYDLYTRQHGIETNLFLAPGEGDSTEDVGAEAKNGDAAGRQAGGLNDAMRLMRGQGS